MYVNPHIFIRNIIIFSSQSDLFGWEFYCHQIFEKYVQNWIAIAAPFRGEFSDLLYFCCTRDNYLTDCFCITDSGAPGYITSTLLNGMSFVNGWEQNFFVSKWSMHQLVMIN